MASTINASADENVKRVVEFLRANRRRLTTAERLKDYNGDYKTKEWDTGEPVSKEVL